MARDGARFIMLGTPNQGAHSMVETLIGAGDTIRQLARADVAIISRNSRHRRRLPRRIAVTCPGRDFKTWAPPIR